MTKTTPLRFSLTAIFLGLTLISVGASDGAELTVRPAIEIVQEYNDNIFLEKNNKNSDYITRIIPSVSVNYKAPFWDWRFDYALNWWYYHKLGRSYDSHRLNLSSDMNIISNFLYLNVSDTYSNVVLDERISSSEDNLNVNRTDTNTFVISPYVKYRLTPVVTVVAGYRYTNIWFREEEGTNRQLHTGYASLERVFSPSLSATVGIEYTKDEPENPYPDNSRTGLFVKAAYALTQRTDADATLGYRIIDFSVSSDQEDFFYNFRIIHRFYATGEIELKASSDILVSSLYGVYEAKTEQLTIRYGDVFRVSGIIFHRSNRYYETDIKDQAWGNSVFFEYRPKPRLMFSLSGGYEKNVYKPQDEIRETYLSAGEISYQLTEKAKLSLRNAYIIENGRTDREDYKNNVISFRISMTI